MLSRWSFNHNTKQGFVGSKLNELLAGVKLANYPVKQRDLRALRFHNAHLRAIWQLRKRELTILLSLRMFRLLIDFAGSLTRRVGISDDSIGGRTLASQIEIGRNIASYQNPQ